jgi:uncharacterized membrane protein
MNLNYLKFPVILLIIDAFWLSRPIHKVQIEKIQKSPLQLDMTAGVLFYILAAFAYHRFVQPFAITKKDAFKIGATIGVLMYGTFDLTNKAIFKEKMTNTDTGKVRINEHVMYMESDKEILAQMKKVGFLVQGKIDLIKVGYEYQYLYIFLKPG